jgi:hypothetical protein
MAALQRTAAAKALAPGRLGLMTLAQWPSALNFPYSPGSVLCYPKKTSVLDFLPYLPEMAAEQGLLQFSTPEQFSNPGKAGRIACFPVILLMAGIRDFEFWRADSPSVIL